MTAVLWLNVYTISTTKYFFFKFVYFTRIIYVLAMFFKAIVWKFSKMDANPTRMSTHPTPIRQREDVEGYISHLFEWF